jgi:pSer/pThr/pTyr-binding forkhead associated (FHA) protein
LPEARAYGVTLLDPGTGQLYEAHGVRIRLGRGRECEVRLSGRAEPVVSRVHAELTVGASGALAVQDAGSTNGTFLNDERVTSAVPVRLGDRIALGAGGPVLILAGLGTAPRLPVARPSVAPGRRLAWRVGIVVVLLLLAGAAYGVYRLIIAR